MSSESLSALRNGAAHIGEAFFPDDAKNKHHDPEVNGQVAPPLPPPRYGRPRAQRFQAIEAELVADVVKRLPKILAREILAAEHHIRGPAAKARSTRRANRLGSGLAKRLTEAEGFVEVLRQAFRS
jgi:hypothetical protein